MAGSAHKAEEIVGFKPGEVSGLPAVGWGVKLLVKSCSEGPTD